MFEDFTWENTAAACWSVAELTSALTCCCLPTLRPLQTRYFPSLGSRIGRSTKGYAQTYEDQTGTGATSTVGPKSANRNTTSDGGGEDSDEIELRIGERGLETGSVDRRPSTSAASVSRGHITAFQPTVRTDISLYENPHDKKATSPIRAAHPGDIVVQREVYMSTSTPKGGQ